MELLRRSMKKFKITYEEIASYNNIYAAYLDARKKKSERNEIMRFSMELDSNLNELYKELQEGRYKSGGYRIIYIYVPKKRLIMALQFKDRVLQWAIYRLLNPLYEKTYIKDSYACIKGRGREKAAKRLQYWLRQTDRKPKQYYYLKLDISKFFYRVDHEILLNILKRRIKDKRLIDLFNTIINSEKRAFGLPLGVDPCEIDPREMLFDKGMPIGNLTSQMFANIYMNELDQYLKHELHLKYVIRYADDCIILHDSKEELQQILKKIEIFLLEKLRLNLNSKTAIRPTTCNVDFVGYVINKDEIRLRSATVKRMRSRIKYIVKAYERGEMTLKEVNATMQSYFGLMKYCTNEGLKENIINGFVLHCTDAARAKARESR
jgi:retron-type reverse transcriptase